MLVAGALALALHVVVLMPPRPTLIGSSVAEPAPTMVVRLLTRETLVEGVRGAQTATEALVVAALPAPPGPPAVVRSVEVPPDNPARSPAAAKAAPGTGVTPAPAAAPLPQPGLPPAPDYFAGGQLDPGPRPLENVDPLYPEEAKLQEGSVVLRLLINEAGNVDNVAVVQAYPAGLFEESALEAFGKAKFSPGRMLGVPVKSQITIEVMFTPINRGKVSGRSY